MKGKNQAGETIEHQEIYEKKSAIQNFRGIAFAIAAFLYQVMVCFIYAFRFNYSPDFQSTYEVGEILLVSGLTILAIIGFGLMNSYITNASFSGMSMTLLAFAFTIEHFFFMRAFWDKAGASDPTGATQWADIDYNRVSYVNLKMDRFDTHEMMHASLVDAIACAIAMIVAMTPLIGRIQLADLFLMTLFGAFFYEINSQLIWKYVISDIGYGMRIFIFGSAMGLISAQILGRKPTTADHRGYYSIYSSRVFGLLGLVFCFCLFPLLCVAGIYETSANNDYILYVAPLNMYFALGAGVLGSFVSSTLTDRKVQVYDLVFSGLNGGVAFSSSCNLHRNPAVPMTCGFAVGLVTSLYHSKILKRHNAKGVGWSLGTRSRFLSAGLFSGVLSAILYVVNQGSTGDYISHLAPGRSRYGQGGFQMVGIAFSLSFGIGAGVIVGLLLKFLNKNQRSEQFNDDTIYQSDIPSEVLAKKGAFKEF